MESKTKLSELLKCVNALSEQEKEQFASEILFMMVNQDGHTLNPNQKPSGSESELHPEADIMELAFLLKRLNHHHNDYIRQIM